MTKRRTFTVSALALVTLTLAACGSSGGSKSSGPSDGTNAKSTAAADLALAKSAGLTAADLPGYTSKPYKKSDDLPTALKQQFATCMNTSVSLFDDVPGAQEVHSPKFSKDRVEVTSSVEIDPKQSDIDTGWEQLSNPAATGCLQALFAAALERTAARNPGVTIGTPTVTAFPVGIGDRSTGFSVVIPITAQGTTQTVYDDRIFVARDRAGIDLDTTSDQPVDRAAEIALAQKIYDRIGDGAR